MTQLESSRSDKPAWRLRDRIFVVLTANLALACTWATYHVSQVKVLDPYRTQIYLAAWNSPGDVFDTVDQANQKIASIEFIVYVWRRIMWGVAGVLELVALLAAITRRGRFFHLLGAGVILLSTVATMVGMRFLVNPEYGGMQPLAARWYVIAAAAQSGYGVLLLIFYARKPRAPAIPAG